MRVIVATRFENGIGSNLSTGLCHSVAGDDWNAAHLGLLNHLLGECGTSEQNGLKIDMDPELAVLQQAPKHGGYHGSHLKTLGLRQETCNMRSIETLQPVDTGVIAQRY